MRVSEPFTYFEIVEHPERGRIEATMEEVELRGSVDTMSALERDPEGLCSLAIRHVPLFALLDAIPKKDRADAIGRLKSMSAP